MILLLICLAFALIGWGLAGPIGAGVAILIGLLLVTYGYALVRVVLEERRERRYRRRELERKQEQNLEYQHNVASVLRREIERGESEERIAETRRQLEKLEQEAIEKLGLSGRRCAKAQRSDKEDS